MSCFCFFHSLFLSLAHKRTPTHTLSLFYTLFLLFSFKPYVPVHTAKVIDRIALAKDDEKALHSEVSILQKLTHKNVVNCCDFYIEEKKLKKNRLHLYKDTMVSNNINSFFIIPTLL